MKNYLKDLFKTWYLLLIVAAVVYFFTRSQPEFNLLYIGVPVVIVFFGTIIYNEYKNLQKIKSDKEDKKDL